MTSSPRLVNSRRNHSFISILLSPSRMPMVLGDLLAASAGFISFSSLVKFKAWELLSSENWVYAALFSIVFAVSALGLGYYERENRFSWRQVLVLGVSSWVIATVISLILFYFAFFLKIGRVQLATSAVGALVSVLALRALILTRTKGFFFRYCVLGDPLSQIMREIRDSKAYSRIGERYDYAAEIEDWNRTSTNGDPHELVDLMMQGDVAEIVLTRNALQDERIVRRSMHALRAGYRVVDEVTFYTEVFERYPVQALTDNWILFSGIDVHRHLTLFAKRSFDLAFASILLVLGMPLFLLIAVLIKLTSRGPVLFVQPRQGRFCVPFNIFKFRTMKVGTPEGLNPPSTRVHDPRVTSIGRWIRPLHLDEFPQLLNILRGEMSFVGPRPEDIRFSTRINREIPIYDYRHLLRPGLTGPAQLQLGYTLDNAEDTYRKLAYDLYYLRHHNLLYDFVTLTRTVFFLARRAR